MTRNRQLSRLVRLARTGKMSPHKADRPQRPRRALRRVLVAAALTVAALVAAQIVFAAPPTANFTISPGAPAVNQTVTFTSTSSDADNDIATYEWDFNYDGSFNASATGTSASTSYSTGGSKTVALRVTDGAGDPSAGGDGTVDTDVSVQSFNVTVPNQNPTATAVTFTRQAPNNGDIPYVGQTIGFSGSGSDPDGDPITYEWSFGDGGTATGQDVTHAYSSRGTKTVTLTVRDNRGGTGSRQEQITINAVPVAGPDILNAAAEPGQKHNTPGVGQDFAYVGTGLPALPGQPALPGSSDAEDGTNLTYLWDLDNNGTFETTGQANTGNTAQPPPLPPAGLKTVVLRVIDSHGATNDKSLTFRVNTPPQPGFSADPVSPVIGDEVTFSSTSTDADDQLQGVNEQLTYAWSFDLDNNGSFETPGGQAPIQKRTFQPAGTYGIKLAVTDSGGLTRPFTRKILVENTRPGGSISTSTDSPLPGQAVTFSAAASSPTGKSIATLQWNFDFNPGTFDETMDQFVVHAEGNPVSHSFATPGPKTVALKIAENGGGARIVTKTITVNAPPQAGFSVAPETAFVGDTVTLSSSSSDPDGPLAKQEWDLDNDGQFDDANAAIVSAKFGKADTYPLKLRVTDSKGATSTATGKVTVQDRPVPPLQVLPGVVIEGRFLLFKRDTKVKFLRVRAPKGSKITIRCIGKKNCPKRLSKTSKGSKKLQFKKLERMFRPKTKLVVTVTKNGFIGKQTTFTLRRRKPPVRKDLCVNPGAKKANSCPGG